MIIDNSTAAAKRRQILHRLYSIQDLATHLGEKHRTFYSAITRGLLKPPTHVLGKRKYYSLPEFKRISDAWFASVTRSEGDDRTFTDRL